jgi:hypothetical protein
MSTPLLVKHPAPHPTESLAGYVLRLSEANGYKTPQSLYQLAGMRANESSWTNFASAKLAAIANQPVALVERIAFKHVGNAQNDPVLLGEPVGRRDLNLTGARHCPACVSEKGFIEAHWHIDLMVGCSVHKQAGVWFCGNCKNRVSWSRIGLLTCECGSSLSKPPQYLFQDEDWWLLDLIRRKALGDRTSLFSDPRMPENQLANISLHNLLSLVRILGQTRMSANKSPTAQLGKPVLKAAANVLRDLDPRFSEHLESGLEIDFASIETLVRSKAALRYSGKHSAINDSSSNPSE